MSNTKTQEACTQEKRENLQFLINLNTQKNKTIQMETANFNIRPHQKDITDYTNFDIYFFNAFHFISILEFFHTTMIDYTLTEEDIMFCRKAIEDYDDDGNGRIGIFDL